MTEQLYLELITDYNISELAHHRHHHRYHRLSYVGRVRLPLCLLLLEFDDGTSGEGETDFYLRHFSVRD